jgi:hypothetical protein
MTLFPCRPFVPSLTSLQLFENSSIPHYQTDISYTCGINSNAYAHVKRDSYAGQFTLSGLMPGFMHIFALVNSRLP